MKKWLVFLFMICTGLHSLACSTFVLSRDGLHVFGRNYDWVSGNGMLMVNARGVAKTSYTPDGRSITWVSAYGSTTFNQFGKEFPHGGMNEKGLVVELMWLNGTIYPAADNRAALNELQWIQYQLDNCATIEEVIATDKKIRINRAGAAPLHYLVADAHGRAATIEFINGKMVVHQGNNLDYPVLTNTVYDEAVKQVQAKKSKLKYDNSVERFATVCTMIQQFQNKGNGDHVDYAFTILDRVAQKGYTKWSIVYDISKRQVYYRTDVQPQRKVLAFGATDFSCTGTTPTIHLSAPGSGNVAGKLTPLSFEQNKKLIEQSARESQSQVTITKESIAGAAGYFKQVACKS